MKKKLRRGLYLIFLLIFLYGFYYCWISFPIATGYAAKVMCSAVFVSVRNEDDVLKNDLDFFPVNLVSIAVDRSDSSVAADMFGFAGRKAIYRNRLGATLVNDLTEQQIRSQRVIIPEPGIIQRDTMLWPMGDRVSDSFPTEVDTTLVNAAVRKVFDANDKPEENFTRALIVLYDGNIIAERYATGFNAHMRLGGWSMTKSITGALTSILVKKGMLDIDQPARLAEWSKPEDPRRSITLRQLLQQTSGLAFDEVYDKRSHANTMLFMKGNAGGYAAEQPLKHPPGTVFSYSSGNSNIISRLIREKLGDGNYYSFPYTELFYNTGMYSAVLEPDASGTFVGSSFCYATARDWARFGLLYANKGRLNGKQILPENWVKQSTIPSDAAQQGQYGFQWWLNRGAKNDSANRLYPELPADMFFADGYEGQNIFVIPSKKIVVVRLGLTRGKQWGENMFLKQIIQSVPKSL